MGWALERRCAVVRSQGPTPPSTLVGPRAGVLVQQDHGHERLVGLGGTRHTLYCWSRYCTLLGHAGAVADAGAGLQGALGHTPHCTCTGPRCCSWTATMMGGYGDADERYGTHHTSLLLPNCGLAYSCSMTTGTLYTRAGWHSATTSTRAWL